MIPESAGATPYGIFLLADEYLDAARSAAESPGRHTGGPVRLLAYHASELFLKAYMRAAGETVAALRDHGHDLSSMAEKASALGLKLPTPVFDQARRMTSKNDYVRARYVVVRVRRDVPTDSALRFVGTVRQSVITALGMNEAGVPQGKQWIGALPSDYPSIPTG